MWHRPRELRRQFQRVHSSQRLSALHEEDRATAEIFFRDAIEEEPNFASPHIYLAWVVRSRGGDFLTSADRALELSDSAPDPERYFIQASHAHLHGRFEKALPYYKALISVAPHHFWGNRNLLFLSEQLGHWETATSVSYRLPEIFPWDPTSNFYGAGAAVAWSGDFERAREYVERIKKRGESSGREVPFETWIWNFEIFEAWYRNDLKAVQELTDELVQKAQKAGGHRRLDLITRAGLWYMTLGQFEAAEEAFRWLQGIDFDLMMAISALLGGDKSRMPGHLEKFWSSDPQRYLGTAIMLSAHAERADLIEDRIRRFLEDPSLDRHPEKTSLLFEGALAASQRDPEVAVRKLEQGLYGDPSGSKWLTGWLLLTDLLTSQGRYFEAVQHLRRVPQSFVFSEGAAFWVAARIRLVEAAAHTGDLDQVATLQGELQRLLRLADPGVRSGLQAKLRLKP